MRQRNSAILEVIPSARRLVTSLRDVGYDFVHAVADLIDNSIEARAKNVNVELRFEGKDSWLRIADDGVGMSAAQIKEAIRYGSQRDYELDDLGKFGLGLKTASLSQCRRLSVASRQYLNQRQVEACLLDLDHIENTDRWEVFALRAREIPPQLSAPLRDHPGTVVLWEQLDRVSEYKLPWGERARSGMLALAEQLETHLAMVFHRFLAGEIPKRPKLKITLNGNLIEPWDPFARDEKATQILPDDEIEVHSADGVGTVRVRPYILPSKERFSSEAAFNRLSGPNRWNSQQGFYIYRSNRMIQSGGWCRMRTLDEHTKLARIALDFFPDLDSAFAVNVAKAKVVPPAELKERLKQPIEQVIRLAKAAYKQSGESRGASMTDTVRSQRSTTARSWQASGPSSPLPLTTRAPEKVDSLREALEEAADAAGETVALKKIIKVLQKIHPEACRDLGW